MPDELTILDLSTVLPGSYASLLLADLGAEVIKVEPPDGELTRSWEPTLHGVGHRFLQRSRNKQSICLDLKTEDGRDIFLELVGSADVVIEGFRPGTAEKLGIGFDTARAVNPDVIYCSITGYGRTSNRSNHPGHDGNYLGLAGVLGPTAATAEPTLPRLPISDFAGGLFAAFSIFAALRQREEHGGQHLDIAMTDIMANWMLLQHAGEYIGAEGDYDATDAIAVGAYACYNVYPTADGQYMVLGAVERPFWEAFCDAVGLDRLIDDHLKDDRREERKGIVADRLRQKTAAEWRSELDQHRIPISRVRSLEEVFESEYLHERKLVDTIQFEGEDLFQVRSPFNFSGFEHSLRSSPPRLGENSTEILKGLGYTPTEIQQLRDSEVVR